jgi:two-component system C4-dicarboxylate transport response regulator DctD
LDAVSTIIVNELVIRPPRFPRVAEDSGANMQTILLVDNDPLQALFLKSLLERRFRSVLRVADAAEALCLVEQPHFALSLGLVISPPTLPGIGGPEFVAELHERQPHVPVLVLGGSSEETDRDSHGGYVRYLSKPYANQELLDVANEMLMQDVRSEELYRNRRAS